MSYPFAFGRAHRLARLSKPGDHRFMVVPLDHFITDGPSLHVGDLGRLTADLSRADVDAVVLHKGSVRWLDPEVFRDMSLILHMSASTAHAPDPDAKCLVADVEEAVALGADAVSVHVNLGSLGERDQVADLGRVATACDRWNVPLLAMMYPRGPKVTDPTDPDLVAHCAQVAGDLGADLVKVPACRTSVEMHEVTSASPIPVITAGGHPRGTLIELVETVHAQIDSGTAGVAMGRSVFQSEDPGSTARAVSAAVHRPFADADAVTDPTPALAAAR